MFEFVVHGWSHYVKNPENWRSIFATKVFLEGYLIIVRSGTQKYSCLSETEAMFNAGSISLQDMLYVM